MGPEGLRGAWEGAACSDPCPAPPHSRLEERGSRGRTRPASGGIPVWNGRASKRPLPGRAGPPRWARCLPCGCASSPSLGPGNRSRSRLDLAAGPGRSPFGSSSPPEPSLVPAAAAPACASPRPSPPSAPSTRRRPSWRWTCTSARWLFPAGSARLRALPLPASRSLSSLGNSGHQQHRGHPHLPVLPQQGEDRPVPRRRCRGLGGEGQAAPGERPRQQRGRRHSQGIRTWELPAACPCGRGRHGGMAA